MTAERWGQIKEIFGTASDVPEMERRDYLASACSGDAELRAEVERLLAESDKPSLRSPTEDLVRHRGAEPALPGEIINGYRVLERLGAGGMGLVYRAIDTKLERHVALKFLPAELEIDEDARATLVNEARAASALDHPNIGTIYGIEETQNRQQFIVMAYYEGQTLAQKLRHGPLPAQEGAAIALQVANGLAEAHAHRIVHRDIKPSNIFLTRQGLVKIVDFGIARVIRSALSTRSAHISGTAAYMSPEQAEGRFLDARTDLWSLGAVLYEMADGRRAFETDDMPATLFAIVNTSPPDLGDNVPPVLQKIVYHALAKRPQDRYQNATDMIQELRQFCHPDVQPFDPTASITEVSRYRRLAARPSATRKGFRRFRWLLALTLMTILVAIFSVSRRQTIPSKSSYDSYLKAAEYIQRYDKQDNLNRAVALLQQVVRADPDFAPAFASLGDAYRLQSRLSGDKTLLKKALSYASHGKQLNDGLASVHVVIGKVQSALGNHEIALDEFRRAQKLEPTNADALSGLAGEYAGHERTQEAEELYRRAAALRPESWDGYNSLGIFLKAQKRSQEAAQQFQRVIELTPDNLAGYVNLATTLVDLGRLDDAEATLKKALQRDPSSYAVYTDLGLLYYRRRLYPQAAQAIRYALRLNDRDWRTWKNLAVTYRWLGEHGQAVAAYKKALPLLEQAAKVEPQNAYLQSRLAELYAYSGARENASSRIETSLALAPHNSSVLISCAEAYDALGDHSRAITVANEAVVNGLTLAQLNEDPEARRFRADRNFNRPK
jgi:eukaryotic-like serine/threonine-protein kinase